MKPFDPGGAVPSVQHMAASSGQSGSVQLLARREFFCPRGLKEGLLPEDAGKRVLHCTHGAVLYFPATFAQISALRGVLDNGQISSVPRDTTGVLIYLRRKINASDGSSETMAGMTEGQEHIPADCSSRAAHKKLKEILGCSSLQQEDNGFGHVSSSKLASLPASHIPRAFALHISCDEMQQANGFCIEDPEAPSTPDLQPEVRSWDCEALFPTGAERMLPADNVCLPGADNLVSGELTCKKDEDDILPVPKPLSKEGDIVSTCIIQRPAGKGCSSVSKLSYKCSSDDSKSTNGKNSFRELNFHACRQYMAQRLSAGLVIAGSPAAFSNKLPEHEEAHVMVNKYSDRGGRFRTAGKNIVFVQVEMLAMLWVFSQRYLAPRSGNNFWLRYLYLEQEIEGSFNLIECSRSSSKVSIVSANNSLNWFETDSERLSMTTELVRELMPDFEEYLGESYGSSSWVRETGSSKIMEVVEDSSCIPNEQVGQSLETCRSHLQAPRTLNIKCSNGDIIDQGGRHFLARTEDNGDEASSLPVSAAVHGPCSPTLSQCSLSSDLSMEGWKSSLLRGEGEVHERRSRAKLEQFAEIFLLRRHIKQQQQRAQQAPPYPCRGSAGLAADAESPPTNIAVRKPSLHTCSSTNPSMKSFENMKHEPTMILTAPLCKPCDVSTRFCDDGIRVGADVVIDIVGLVEYIEKHTSKLETFTDVAVNSIRCTHMPFTGGQLVIPNVNAVIVTIVAIMVYTKILLEGALSWVGSRTHDSEDKK